MASTTRAHRANTASPPTPLHSPRQPRPPDRPGASAMHHRPANTPQAGQHALPLTNTVHPPTRARTDEGAGAPARLMRGSAR